MTDSDRTARAAVLALDPPAVLIQGVLDRLAALILQHDALRVLSVEALATATSCPCEDCRATTVDILKNLAAIERDQLRLETAGDLVDKVSHYVPPTKPEIDRAVKDHRRVVAVDALERALEAPPAGEGQ